MVPVWFGSHRRPPRSFAFPVRDPKHARYEGRTTRSRAVFLGTSSEHGGRLHAPEIVGVAPRPIRLANPDANVVGWQVGQVDE
jgi:hypothetical protein